MKTTKPDPRQRALAKVHIAKAQLGLDDDTYRQMLREITGVDSASGLDMAGLARVLNHLRERGWKSKSGKDVPRYRGRPNPPQGMAAMMSKVEALLAEAGRPWAYADGMARRICKVDKVAWCSADQLRKIIAALVYDARRQGRRTS